MGETREKSFSDTLAGSLAKERRRREKSRQAYRSALAVAYQRREAAGLPIDTPLSIMELAEQIHGGQVVA
jgi:hypothetical protein